MQYSFSTILLIAAAAVTAGVALGPLKASPWLWVAAAAGGVGLYSMPVALNPVPGA